ncbi:MAG: 50S ribosomal protein L6 [Lentisphaeria bacterium]|nr:50S ribosomal protein L6 [Lentisphaeria bacterium]
MSRMGNKPIALDPKVKVEIKDGMATVTGPKGTLKQALPGDVLVEISEDGKLLHVKRESDARQTKMNHGLVRSLLNNMVTGVTTGFTIELELVGVGYRAAVKGQELTLNLGYSNPRIYNAPESVKVTCKDQTHIVLESIDKQAVGQAAASIRSNRVPDAYHGKGVRYAGEQLSLKEGKKV